MGWRENCSRLYDLEKEDEYIDKQSELNHMIKSLLKQKNGAKALLDNKKITPKQFNRFVENIQVCYDSLLKNKNFEMEFDFKTEDMPLSKNHLRKQRQEHFAFVKK